MRTPSASSSTFAAIPEAASAASRLMSYLTPDRVPIGYSWNRKMAQERRDPATLPIFNKIPRSKLAIPGLALKFLGKTSVFVHTEGLGRRPYHGRVAILVNRHTTGAAEMVAQFAQEHRLAVISGEKTPGRLVSRSAFKLGFGYRLVIPVAAYVSAKGTGLKELESPLTFPFLVFPERRARRGQSTGFSREATQHGIAGRTSPSPRLYLYPCRHFSTYRRLELRNGTDTAVHLSGKPTARLCGNAREARIHDLYFSQFRNKL